MLLVVEEGTSAADQAVDSDNDINAFEASLPQPSRGEVAGIRQHYLGYTTWQETQRTFSLDPYPDTVGDLKQ